MNTKKLILLLLTVVLCSCTNKNEKQALLTFDECLLKSLEGNHNFTLEEVKSICTDISDLVVIDWDNLPNKSKHEECMDAKNNNLTNEINNPNINITKIKEIINQKCE